MEIHINAPAQPSGAMSNAHFVIEVIPLPDAVRYNQNLPPFVNDFFDISHEIRDSFSALEERLKAAVGSNHQSLILEDANDVSDKFMATGFFLTPEMQGLAHVREKVSQRLAMLQSTDDGLDVKLNCLDTKKMLSIIFFTTFAGICAGATVIAVNVNPKMIALAALAAAGVVLIGPLGKEIRSLLKKPESALKKNRDIKRTMLNSAKIIIDRSTRVYGLACDLQSETECFLKMVRPGHEAAEVAVMEKVLSLNMSFRNVQRKAKNCSLDVSSALETVFQSIIRNSV